MLYMKCTTHTHTMVPENLSQLLPNLPPPRLYIHKCQTSLTLSRMQQSTAGQMEFGTRKFG